MMRRKLFENSNKKITVACTLAFLLCIAVVLTLGLKYGDVLGPRNSLQGLEDMPRLPSGLKSTDARIQAIKLVDGKIVHLGSRNRFMITGRMSESDFDNFIVLFGLTDGLGERIEDLHFYKEPVGKMRDKVRAEIESMNPSDHKSTTFEGACRDAFFSGAFCPDTNGISFMVGY